MSLLKKVAQLICTVFEALGKLVVILHRHPNGAMAFLVMLALVLADVPLIAMLKYQAPTGQNTQAAAPVAHGDPASVRRLPRSDS